MCLWPSLPPRPPSLSYNFEVISRLPEEKQPAPIPPTLRLFTCVASQRAIERMLQPAEEINLQIVAALFSPEFEVRCSQGPQTEFPGANKGKKYECGLK